MTRDRELRVLDATESLGKPAVEDRDLHALLVEHLHALVGIEARGVLLLIEQRVSEVLVQLRARVAEPGETHRDADAVFDPELLRLELVAPADAWTHLAHRRRKVALPEIHRLTHMAVRIDDHRTAAVPAHHVP